MRYFDYKTTAEKAHIPKGKLDKLCRIIRREFPKDNMMYELHVLRACKAILEGYVRLEDVLRLPKRHLN